MEQQALVSPRQSGAIVGFGFACFVCPLPLCHVCLQDFAEFADEDLQELGKMAGLNMLNRRRLIKAVAQMREEVGTRTTDD